MVDDIDSTLPRRQLGRLLRELREHNKMSQDDAARALGCSRQKIWRIETGQTPVNPNDVKVLCNLYKAGQRITQALTGLAEATQQSGWWHAFGDTIPSWFSLYVGLEGAASRLRQYDGELIPGLLQTRRYAAAIFANRPDMPEDEQERAVTVRLQRQGLLTRQFPAPPQLDVILSEAVLLRRIGDRHAMQEQVRHLARMAELYNITVRILPLDAGPLLASEAGAFRILDFPTTGNSKGPHEPTTVYAEYPTGSLYLSKPKEVAAYERVWSNLADQALDEAESLRMINRIAGAGESR
ncbi:helix-turn-helix domain-containing protein [Micromonospora sp. CPCC 205371]|nr:helix-turn-helix domain-containing protein [Micromonospora sp. CPCC 205371]